MFAISDLLLWRALFLVVFLAVLALGAGLGYIVRACRVFWRDRVQERARLLKPAHTG